MDYQAGTTSQPRIAALLFVWSLLIACANTVNAQVISATTTVTITACVDDGNGSCNPPTPPSNPSGGSSGGGGGGASPGPVSPDLNTGTDSAVFRGLAYPGSIVTLLKNGVIAAEVPASPDGTFEITLRNLKAGTYSFGILAEDSQRLKSSLNLYTVYVASGVSTQVEGIFLPPTVTTDKIQVKQGDPLSLMGTAAPNAQVTLLIHSDTAITKTTTSNSSGGWIYKLDTLPLEMGQHEAKSRTQTDTDLSLFSDPLTFTVGTQNIARTATNASSQKRNCDLNGDSRVNILDFSILAYWYKRAGFPIGIDLNSDGKINLADVSILAYCWTG